MGGEGRKEEVLKTKRHSSSMLGSSTKARHLNSFWPFECKLFEIGKFGRDFDQTFTCPVCLFMRELNGISQIDIISSTGELSLELSLHADVKKRGSNPGGNLGKVDLSKGETLITG